MISQRHWFLAHQAQTSPAPLGLEIVHARGLYVKDIHGKRYMDLISGISVSNLGHRHPAVQRAIQRQMRKYLHLMVYGEYIQTPQVQLAKTLVHYLPENLQSVYFVNSGSEAIEGALKLAKRFTGRTEIIHFKNSYHGSTHGALSIMGDEYFKNAYRPLLPDTRCLDYGNTEQLQYITSQTACVVIEPVQAEAGIILPPEGYLQAVAKCCKENGALLIVDEIQTGMGRTGNLFAFENAGIQPDILCLAKSFGGGLPLGAFISSHEIMHAFTENPVLGHITTFGGNAVCCAAALANLKEIAEGGWLSQVESKGKMLAAGLAHPLVKQIRQKGLMLGVEFADEPTNKAVIQACIDNGIITDWFLFNDKTLRISAPLIITEDEIARAVKKMQRAMNTVASRHALMLP